MLFVSVKVAAGVVTGSPPEKHGGGRKNDCNLDLDGGNDGAPIPASLPCDPCRCLDNKSLNDTFLPLT